MTPSIRRRRRRRCARPSARPCRAAARSSAGRRPGASISTTDLSVSISATRSPGATVSPSALTQRTILPSLMVRSPNGMVIGSPAAAGPAADGTAAAARRRGRLRRPGPVRRGEAPRRRAPRPRHSASGTAPGARRRGGRAPRRAMRSGIDQHRPLERRRERMAHRIGVEAGDGRVEIVVGDLVHRLGELGADAAHRPGLVDDEQAVGPGDARGDRGDIERHDGAEIDHLGLDPFGRRGLPPPRAPAARAGRRRRW